MIIYNTTWLANLRLQNQVKKEVGAGRITNAEFSAIAATYRVGFYSPNMFVRAALFLLTCVIIAFTYGLLSLMASNSNIVSTSGWVIFLGGITYAAMELMVQGNKYYRAGIDDALMLVSAGMLLAGIGTAFSYDGGHSLAFAAVALTICLYLTLRCADMLMSAGTCCAFFAVVFFAWIKMIPAGLATAPFVMMLVAFGLYKLAFKYDKQKAKLNYTNCLMVAQLVSLLALYAAGNYYVIKTLSTQMAGNTGQVPFGGIFWAWTILLPLLYIGFGLKRKDVLLLRTGLLLVAAAAATFRTYYHILPTDVALTLAGTLILGIVYIISKYLKAPKHGFTLAELDDINPLGHLKVESLLVAETFAHTPSAPAATANDRFGGGSFGGGGSSGGY